MLELQVILFSYLYLLNFSDFFFFLAKRFSYLNYQEWKKHKGIFMF